MTATARTAARREPLRRGQVLRAAVALADQGGIGAVLVWTGANVPNIRAAAQTGAEASPTVISGPGLVSDCLVWGSGGVPCGVVPTRTRTWGQLKSLYR